MVKKILTGILIAFFVIAVAAFGVIYYLGHRGLPEYDGRLVLQGLIDEVTVYRDAYAVAHIYAKNESDLYRAVGYCMAQDRLFQMDLIRRLTSGRLSEIMGDKTVDVDYLMRALRITEKSRNLRQAADPAMLRSLEAFCDGINQFIAGRRGRLPIEFTLLGYQPEEWQPEHAFNVIGYFSFNLSTAWHAEIGLYKILQKVGEQKLREIMPDTAAGKEIVFPEFTAALTELDLRATLVSAGRLIEELGLTFFHGSNNWAVAGEKSDTGRPIFANDMHLGLSAPGIWYQIHQVVEGKLNVTGVAAPGQPLIIAGHNDRIAWGFTNVMLDDMDFYLERINPANPDEYEFNGQWRKMRVARETIKLKGGGTVEKQIRFTHRGPVISEIKGIQDQVISMRWIGNEPSDEVRSLFLLNQAGNWDEFKNALRTFRSISQNALYADKEGNIGMYCAAGIPIRKKGDGISVMPGWTDAYDWQGLVPFEEQPHQYNPASQFLSSANNKTTGDDYPYYISTWFAPDHRIRRINEMLAGKSNVTIADIQAMQADFQSKLVEDMQADLVASLGKAKDFNEVEKQCLQILKDWHGVLNKDQAAPALFETFYIGLVKNLFKDELGDQLFGDLRSMNYVVTQAVDRLWRHPDSSWFDDVDTTDRQEGFDDIVQASFKEAVAGLIATLGDDPDQWQWGSIHQLTLEHPLGSVAILDRLFQFNQGPYPVDGSYHTVCPYQYRLSNPFNVVHGASHRHIYSLADWDASLSVIPTGTSGIPASEHYDDQTALYLRNEYHADLFSRDAVERNARYVSRLSGR